MLDIFSKASIELCRLKVSTRIHLLDTLFKKDNEIKLILKRQQKCSQTKSLEYILYSHPILTESINRSSVGSLEHLRSDMHAVLGFYAGKVDPWVRTKNSQNA